MKNLFGLIAFSFGLTLLACSGGSKEKTNQEEAAAEDAANAVSDNQPANMQEAMQQAQDAMKNLQAGKQVEPINFRELQELLPEELAGFERTSKGGESSGNLCLPDASWAYHDYVVGHDFVAQLALHMLPAPTVAQCDRHRSFGAVLSDNETVQFRDNLLGSQFLIET